MRDATTPGGIEVRDGPIDIVGLTGMIEDIKSPGGGREASITGMERVLKNLKTRGADSQVLACIEISSLEVQAGKFFPMIMDSSAVVARAALHIAALGMIGNVQ